MIEKDEATEVLLELCQYMDATGLWPTSLTPKMKRWWDHYNAARPHMYSVQASPVDEV